MAAVLGMSVIAGGVALLRSVQDDASLLRPSLKVIPLRIIGSSTMSSPAEAIVEELITALIQDSGIVVLTAPDGAGTGRTGPAIEADYVVDGAIQVEAGSLRMTLRLVRTDDNTAIWAGRYDVQPADAILSPRQAAAQAALEIRAHVVTAAAAITRR
jgi:TolB-like protein